MLSIIKYFGAQFDKLENIKITKNNSTKIQLDLDGT